MISSKTSFIALIGNPVSHSLSPIMQNAALQYLGLDLIYIAVPCKDEDLELVLNSFKKINCKGLNITIPHKEKVFNLCSEISPIANKLKAINTLKLNSEKEWSATNTDVEGFIYPLKKLNLTKKQSIVLGSGGAARSVIQGLINLNFSKISVISRNKSSLDELTKNFKNQIEIHFIINEDNLVIQVTDQGKGFDKSKVEIPNIDEKLGSDYKRGWGLKLIEELMDSVEFESSRSGTTVTMTKNKDDN